MQVKVSNGIEECPDTCLFSKISAEIIDLHSANEARRAICVMVTCDHMDVCKLRRDDE